MLDAAAREAEVDSLRLHLRAAMRHLLPFAPWRSEGGQTSPDTATTTQRLAADAVVVAMRDAGLAAAVPREHLLAAAALYAATGARCRAGRCVYTGAFVVVACHAARAVPCAAADEAPVHAQATRRGKPRETRRSASRARFCPLSCEPASWSRSCEARATAQSSIGRRAVLPRCAPPRRCPCCARCARGGTAAATRTSASSVVCSCSAPPALQRCRCRSLC